MDHFNSQAKKNHNYIELKNQLRMSADQGKIEWIDAFTKYRKRNKIPIDKTGYEIIIFDHPDGLEKGINKIPIHMRDVMLLGTGFWNEGWNCSAPHGTGRIL